MVKPANPWRRKLDALREALGFTHAQLAAELGVSRSTLRSWLYGAYEPMEPTRKLIDLLCKQNRIKP